MLLALTWKRTCKEGVFAFETGFDSWARTAHSALSGAEINCSQYKNPQRKTKLRLRVNPAIKNTGGGGGLAGGIYRRTREFGFYKWQRRLCTGSSGYE